MAKKRSKPPETQAKTAESLQHTLDKACQELLPELAMMQAFAQCDNRMNLTADYLSIPPGRVGFRSGNLKERLGSPLIQAGNKNQKLLTALGKRYIAMADEILPILQRFLDNQKALEAIKQVKIATIQSAWFTYGKDMQTHCKGIDLVVDTPGTPEAVKQSIADRSFHIGILSYDVRIAPPLYRHIWLREKMVLTANRTWKPRLVDGYVTPEQIAGSIALVFSPGLTIERVIREYLSAQMHMPLSRQRAVGREIESIITAVEKGDGISILPLPTIAKNELIVSYDLPVPMAPRPISVIWHRESFDDPNVRKTLEFFGVFGRTGKSAARRR